MSKIDKLDAIAALESRLISVAQVNRELESKKESLQLKLDQDYEEATAQLAHRNQQLAHISSQHINQEEDRAKIRELDKEI